MGSVEQMPGWVRQAKPDFIEAHCPQSERSALYGRTLKQESQTPFYHHILSAAPLHTKDSAGDIDGCCRTDARLGFDRLSLTRSNHTTPEVRAAHSTDGRFNRNLKLPF